MAIERLSPLDPSSFSRPDEVRVTHMDLELDINFQTKILSGNVILTVEKMNIDATHLILDIRDITVKSVKDGRMGSDLVFKLGPKIKTFGRHLEIALPDQERLTLKIEYSTSPKCTALQWLEPAQTSGKKHPFLFSQCQAIHCRSLVPCQDTPGNKITYNAKITAPADLTVLMSAVRDGEPSELPGKRQHSFRQQVPIPSYLLAIVAGNLASQMIGPRSYVWAEPDVLHHAAYEFAETESMLSVAEDICGPYVWNVYDLLVLPPSFPYGGMENPCLTFVTPTTLAGDRSLVDLIAHEIAHSWTGNLVTNSSFEHFWLNEGFTVFVERKIAGRRHGEATRHFSAIAGKKEMVYAVETLGHESGLTCLVPDLSGIDPDDAFSTVPYEKGQTFLWYLEDLVGGPGEFESFLKAYIASFQYRSISTDDFVNYLKHYFKDTPAQEKLENVDWNAWLHSPGMPPVIPNYDDTLARASIDLCQRWLNWDKEGSPGTPPFAPTDLQDFSPPQIQEFLARFLVEDPISQTTVEAMSRLYGFSSVKNFEILFRWIRIGLRAHWKDAVPLAVDLVSKTGRMKFVRPIFRDLYNWKEVRGTAIETFNRVKGQWMYVTTYSVAKDLHIVLL